MKTLTLVRVCCDCDAEQETKTHGSHGYCKRHFIKRYAEMLVDMEHYHPSYADELAHEKANSQPANYFCPDMDEIRQPSRITKWFKSLLPVAALLIATTAFGGAKLIWTPNDSSEGVGKYVIYHGTNIANPFTNFAETATAELNLPKLRSGHHFFFVTAVSTNGFESDPSNQVLAPVPNAPRGLMIQITIP